MNAKQASRINLTNRTRLETVIPLPIPFVVFIDPANVCNFQCEFCANGNRELIKKTGRWQGTMDFDLYKKVIDDLKTFNSKIKVLRLYKEGEPLIHPRLPEMIKYAKDSGIFGSIDFTTNGSLLNPKKNIALLEAGLNRINISVEAMSSEQYRAIAKVELDFEEYIANIRHFYKHRKDCTVFIKTIGNYLQPSQKEDFYKLFSGIADLIAIENLAPCWPEYDMQGVDKDSTAGIYGQQLSRVEVCPYIFYSLTINTDGTVSACFLDWEHKLIVGDLKQQSFVDIWNSPQLLELRKLHLQKKRCEHQVCHNCGQLVYGAPDNIDPYAATLLERL